MIPGTILVYCEHRGVASHFDSGGRVIYTFDHLLASLVDRKLPPEGFIVLNEHQTYDVYHIHRIMQIRGKHPCPVLFTNSEAKQVQENGLESQM